jgi:diguanylate cyclase (GGDEF)-like protein
MIRAVLPEGSLAARLGGDEFVILLSHASSERIVTLGSTLRDQFHALASQTFVTHEAVTLSIGASLFDQPPTGLAVLIEQGDVALYESKRGGRNSIRLVDQTVASR